MKRIYLIAVLNLLLGYSALSQDSVCVVQKGQFLKYRKGYVITIKGDTLKGMIWHKSDGEIFFIREGTTIKTPIFGSFSTIPVFSASDGRIRAFYRNGFCYIADIIPSESRAVFLAVLENGPITLYALLGNYSDLQMSDQFASPGLLTGLAYAGAKTEDEYYDVKCYFLRKGNGSALIRVPQGEKKFLNVFLPLIRDNKVFVKELPMLDVNFFHLRSLVKEYNATSGKN